jgi:hypothetical protein
VEVSFHEPNDPTLNSTLNSNPTQLTPRRCDPGGSEIDVRFNSEDDGGLKVVLAPVLRFKDIKEGTNPGIEELIPFERFMAGFGPELTQNPVGRMYKATNSVYTHSLKAPWFQPLNPETTEMWISPGFQNLQLQNKCNLCRYTPVDDTEIVNSFVDKRDGLTYYNFELTNHTLVAATAWRKRIFIICLKAPSRQWWGAVQAESACPKA